MEKIVKIAMAHKKAVAVGIFAVSMLLLAAGLLPHTPKEVIAETVDDQDIQQTTVSGPAMVVVKPPEKKQQPKVIIFGNNEKDPDAEPEEIEETSDKNTVSENSVSENDISEESMSENSISENSISLNEAENTDSSLHNIAGFSISEIGPVTEESRQLLTQYLGRLSATDPSLIASFKANGWKIVLVADTPYMPDFAAGAAGYTQPQTKTIFIAGNGYEYLIEHEMGHYLDHVLGQRAGVTWGSDVNGFRDIWAQEAAALGTYSMSDSAEFFAEVYRQSITDPAGTQAKCPQAYMFVASCRGQV